MTMPAGWEPDPLGGETVLWKHDVKVGFFRRKVVGMQAITSRRIISPEAEIQLQDLDEAVVTNRREITKHDGRVAPPGRYTGRQKIELRSETEVVGDVAFICNGAPAIVFAGFRNPDYLVSLAMSARGSLLEARSRQEQARGDALVCPKCTSANAPDSKFCKECGRDLTPFCGQCNRENPPGAAFCGGCGTRLA